MPFWKVQIIDSKPRPQVNQSMIKMLGRIYTYKLAWVSRNMVHFCWVILQYVHWNAEIACINGSCKTCIGLNGSSLSLPIYKVRINNNDFFKLLPDGLSAQAAFYDYLGPSAHPASVSHLKEVEYCRAVAANLVPYLIPKRYLSSK